MGAAQRIVVAVADPFGNPPVRPVVIAGGLHDCQVSFPGAIVVQQGQQGWTATDAHTKETRPLDTHPPADIGGWRIAVEVAGNVLVDEPIDLSRSIEDQGSLIEPELRFVDGGAPRSPNGHPHERSIRLPLRDGLSLLIGRARECDVVLTDAKVSRRHLRVLVTQGRFEIEDLGSSWGSFDATGKLFRGKRRFRHGDLVRIGGSSLTLFDPLAQFANIPDSDPGCRIGEDAAATSWLARIVRRAHQRMRVAVASFAAWRGRSGSRFRRWVQSARLPRCEVLVACRDGACAFALVLLAAWCLIAAVSQLRGS